MLFFFHYTDKPARGSLRAATRDAHLAYVDGFAGQIVIGGPTFDEEGNMNGSAIVAEFADRTAAEAFSEGDPYVKAGLFESVVVRPFRKVRPVD